MRLGGGVELVELTSGVDSFYASGRGVLPSERELELVAAREESRGMRAGTPIAVGETTFAVAGSGLNRYSFRLDHEYGVMGVTASASLPTVQVQPKAAFIHSVGVWPALRWFMDKAELVAGPLTWKASRVDLFMDYQGWELNAEDRGRFVCRSRQLVTYEDESDLRTLMFGTAKASVKARIYDKTEESRKKGTDWWPHVWGDAYRPGEQVMRIEFQVMRDALREAQINSPSDALDRLGELWGYLTDGWLSFRDPTQDETRSRWPVSAEWRQVQQASMRADAIGLERVRAGTASGDMRKLKPQLRGYLASAGAILGAQSLSDTLVRVGTEVERYDAARGKSFELLLDEKRRRVAT